MDFKMFNFLKFIESEYFGQCGNADLKYARIFWSKRIEHKISPSKIIHIFTIQTILNGLFYHANVSIRNTFLSLLRFQYSIAACISRVPATPGMIFAFTTIFGIMDISTVCTVLSMI